MPVPSSAFSVPQALAIAAQLQQSGKAEKASALYLKILKSAPGNSQAALQLARIHHQQGQTLLARNILETSIKNGAKSFNIMYMVGAIQHLMGSFELAHNSILRAVQLKPKSAPAHNMLGSNYIETSQYEKAILAFEKSIELNPASPNAHNNLAWAYRALGDKQKAILNFERAVSLDPLATEALSGLALIKTYTQRDGDFDTIESVLNKSGLSTKQRTELEFALGKAHEDIRDYTHAFEHFKQGNSAWRKSLNYDIKQDQKIFSGIKQAFSEPFSPLAATNKMYSHYPTPIFILGMPRSSTSLIEQILASHSSISGAGELRYLEQLCLPNPGQFVWYDKGNEPETSNKRAKITEQYLRQLAKHANGEAWVTDKMPQNFRFIGPILSLFPKAKIIHCRRNPYDTCMSLYKHYFPSNNYLYSYDLKELGEYYLSYEQMMIHWHTIAPGKIYDIQYENLIENFESEVKRLLNYCGLGFEQACLNFHQTKRVVRTASSDQVRQGLFSQGTGRWKHYKQQLQPLIEVFEGSS